MRFTREKQSREKQNRLFPYSGTKNPSLFHYRTKPTCSFIIVNTTNEVNSGSRIPSRWNTTVKAMRLEIVKKKASIAGQ